jgi:N utilization substance protein B
MKILYAISRDESLKIRDAKFSYSKSVSDTFDLFILCLYAFVKVARVSMDDADNRKTKYLPTALDKIFSPTLYENPIIQGLESSSFFNKQIEKKNLSASVSKDFCKNIYYEFLKEEAYLTYLKEEKTDQAHLDILLELFRFCRKSEFFNDVMEENFINWIDDKSVVVGTMKKVLKSDTSSPNVFEKHNPDEQIVEDFGMNLLKNTFEEEEELLDLIKPKLENWDHERLAIIDMILIKMAIVEFLNFETVPVKVTLNEYVDISKIYSTPKSKEFINGILDKLYKELDAEGKINKSGRGLLN